MPINVSMMGTAPDKFRVDNKCAQRRLCPSYKATTFLWEGEAPAEPCSTGIFVGQSLALPVRLLRCPIADLDSQDNR